MSENCNISENFDKDIHEFSITERKQNWSHKITNQFESDTIKPEVQVTTDRESLLIKSVKANRTSLTETDAELVAKEEEDIFKHVAARKALLTAKELALGSVYTSCIESGWIPPLPIRKMHVKRIKAIREKLQIDVEGKNVPPPVESFKNLRLPKAILYKLMKKGLRIPFKIQIQGLPIGLSGRDMIGISYTGSGKTLAFIIPIIMVAYQEEIRLPLVQGEGPVGLVLCPSRELGRQTKTKVVSFCKEIRKKRLCELRCTLCIGGLDSKEQTELIMRRGIHITVGTLGRLKDSLYKKKVTLDVCRILCLDEADRMIDLGFEEDIRDIWSFFRSQRQTLMFSATMPAKILRFAESALVDSVTVKVSRAGAANANIVQQAEYIRLDQRLPFLLDCLSRTAPPVLIFAENKVDVDDVHEYLLIKGVEAVAVHGSKCQDERDLAIKKFKCHDVDVLVATDVASKGLDFPNVKHVINFDMPKDIENYVHRIGRTGRGVNKGLATTLISKDCDDLTLRDLKCLLTEAGQRIPPVLKALEDPKDTILTETEVLTGLKGCIYCGGLGHRVVDCSKRQNFCLG
jgi:ATP-dependent RNA helicase DDX41